MIKLELSAKEFLTSYYEKNEEDIIRAAKKFYEEFKRDEWYFKMVTETYLMTKALYYLLQLDEKLQLSDNEYYSIVRLAYYCSLKNLSTNADIQIHDEKFADYIGCSEIGFIILCKYGQFLINSVLVGQLNYIPNYAQKHIVDQLFICGGIVKDTIERHHTYYIDEEIKRTVNDIIQNPDLYNKLPYGEVLQEYKTECLDVIQNIIKYIEYNFKIDDNDFNF